MNKFIKHSAVAGGLLVGMLSVSGQASAHLAGETTFDFSSGIFRDAFDPQTPIAIAMPGAVFSRDTQDYIQDGIQHSSIGFGTDPGFSVATFDDDFGGGTSHVHGGTTNGSRVSQLEADAGGGFFKLLDGDAFSIGGLDVASMNLALVGGGFSTVTFRGYTSADFSAHVDVTLGDGTSNAVTSADFDTETGAGFNGTHLHLDEVVGFGELYLFEYWFDEVGRANNPAFVPTANNLLIEIDNVEFGPEVSHVPVPAAVYLFGTALLGLGGMRKKPAIAA